MREMRLLLTDGAEREETLTFIADEYSTARREKKPAEYYYTAS